LPGLMSPILLCFPASFYLFFTWCRTASLGNVLPLLAYRPPSLPYWLFLRFTFVPKSIHFFPFSFPIDNSHLLLNSYDRARESSFSPRTRRTQVTDDVDCARLLAFPFPRIFRFLVRVHSFSFAAWFDEEQADFFAPNSLLRSSPENKQS